MVQSAQQFSPPIDDKRWRMVKATMRRHGYQPHALIEALHSVQEAFGYIDQTALMYVAQQLHLPLSRVYGVATFYNYFALQPEGAHTCVVCLGTACYIKGSPHILEEIEKRLHIKAGDTTEDNRVSLRLAHCVGMCWLAPVAVFDDAVEGEIGASEAVRRIEEWTDVS